MTATYNTSCVKAILKAELYQNRIINCVSRQACPQVFPQVCCPIRFIASVGNMNNHIVLEDRHLAHALVVYPAI